nr:MAG TPA: hypothetical protein [Caudoviricetes sp.]DAX31621.1 MAG TPA: hypothetical protein [Caudoviricetes sp.]
MSYALSIMRLMVTPDLRRSLQCLHPNSDNLRI